MSEPALFTRTARLAAARAVDWIVNDDLAAAMRLRQAFLDAAELIGARPEAGRRQPALIGGRYRIWSLTGFPYILIYNPAFRPPRIIRIVHTSRDLPTVLADLRE